MRRASIIWLSAALTIAASACSSKGSSDSKKNASANTSNKGAAKAGSSTADAPPHSTPAPTELSAKLPRPTFVHGTHPDRRAKKLQIALQVSSKSWRKVGAYAIEADLKKRLSFAGVDVVTNPDSTKPVIHVSYEEKRGAPYRPAKPRAGVDTHKTQLVLRITARGKNRKSATLVVRARSGKTVASGDPYKTALDALKVAPGFQYAGAWIGAAIGDAHSRIELAKLLVRDPTAKSILDQLRFRPTAPAERAYAAIAKNDIKTCVKIGAPATHALAYFITGRWGAKKDPELTKKALAAIVTIGGDAASEELVDIVGLSLLPTYQQRREVTKAAIDALATVGDAFALPILQVMTGHWDTQLVAAAALAIKGIIERLPAGSSEGEGILLQVRVRTKAARAVNVPPMLAAAVEEAGFQRVFDPSKARAIAVSRNAAVTIIDLRTRTATGPLTPRATSVRRFARSSWYRALIPFVGCSLGKCPNPEALLPALQDAYNGQVAAKLLDRANHRFAKADHHAYMLAVLGKLDEVEKLGAEGAGALSTLLRKQSRGSPPNVPLVLGATRKLVAMNAKLQSERIAMTAASLGTKLQRDQPDPILEAAVIELLEAFGKLGLSRWVHRLGDLGRHHNKKVRNAALRARAAARARID